jgi:hypothetical protein
MAPRKAHFTSGAFIHCALSLATRKQTTGRWVVDFFGYCFLLRHSSRKTFSYSESGVSNRNFTDGFLLEFDFFPPAIAIDTYSGLPIYIPLYNWAQLQ